MQPNYKLIYSDIIHKKYIHKMQECKALLGKENLSVIEIIELNNKIFGTRKKEVEEFNQKHRSYKTSDIIKILEYQKKHKYNNSQLANHFKISRNTIAKWKKTFLI